MAAYNSLLKQGIKAIKPNDKELVDWEKAGAAASERIEKAGVVNATTLKSLQDYLKTFKANAKS